MKDLISRNLDLFDDEFLNLFRPTERKTFNMKTDIKENDKQYQIEIDMPGFKKEEINVELNNGYLTVSANKNQKEENSENESYIRRERYLSASRSYYVGDKIKDENIKAKYENGVLSLIVPKEEPKKLQEHKIKID